jgi:chromosome segregation protein
VEKEKELNRLLDEFQALEREVSEIQKHMAVLKSEEENAKLYALRITSQISEFEHKTGIFNGTLSSLTEERASLMSQLEEFSASVAEKKDFISGIEGEIADLEGGIEDRRKDIFHITETLSSLNNDLTRFHSAIESMARKEEGYHREIDEISAATDSLEQEIFRTDSLILGKTDDLTMLRAQKENLSAELNSTREEIEGLRSRLASLKEELASDNSRRASLKEITAESLTAEILGQADRFHVQGTISDILRVDKTYEKAVEAVLFDRINGFILASPGDIESAAGFIREKALARTALMPAAPSVAEDIPAPDHRAVIGRAIDFVKAEEAFIPVVKNLLDRVFVVADIQSAFDLKQQHRDCTFVTMNGDVLDQSNTVFSGEGKGILTRKREIRELSDKIMENQSVLNNGENELLTLQGQRARQESEIAGVNDRTIAVEKELSAHRIELQNVHQEKERVQRKKAFIKLEIEQAQQEKENLQGKTRDIENSISGTAARRSELEAMLSSEQEAVGNKKTHYERYRSELTDIKLEMTSYREKIDSLSKEIQSVTGSIHEAGHKITELRKELDQTTASVREKQSASGHLDEQLKKRIIEIDSRRASISGKKEAIGGMSSVLAEKEKRIRAIREQIDEVSARISAHEVAKTEYRLKMENIFNNILRMYGVNIDLFEAGEPSPEELEKIPSLREKIQSIGPVNLGTIEEYEELKTRYEFLTAQQADLVKSIEELEEAIKKINFTTRKRLKDAFVELNAKFGSVFTQLFGGGKAELILTDEQNILESGIDIVAQPPGKKLQNISLLSGGEKALTAIALVFAGFLIKPAPICLLDEADAPLDDSNTDRYASLIKDLANNTQFIVITHNRMTMESADYIYGITMEEPGASKVISMQLTEA